MASWLSIWKKLLDSYFISFRRIYFKWNKDLNFFFLSYESIRKKTKNVCNLWVEFLNNMKTIKGIKEKIDKCEYIKILDFCAKQLLQVLRNDWPEDFPKMRGNG